MRRVAREQHSLGEVDVGRVRQLREQVGALRGVVGADAEHARYLDRLRGERWGVDVPGAAARRNEVAGTDLAPARSVVAGDLERRIEADEPGALLVAGVALRLRVAVEVPARKRRGQWAAERMPAADHLVRPPHLAGDPAPQHRVPIEHRPLEAELAKELGLLRRNEAVEALAVDLGVAPVVVPGDRRIASPRRGPHAGVVLEAVRPPVERPVLDLRPTLRRPPDRVAGDLVERRRAAEEAGDDHRDRVGPLRVPRPIGAAKAQVLEPVAGRRVRADLGRQRVIEADERLADLLRAGGVRVHRPLDDLARRRRRRARGREHQRGREYGQCGEPGAGRRHRRPIIREPERFRASRFGHGGAGRYPGRRWRRGARN